MSLDVDSPPSSKRRAGLVVAFVVALVLVALAVAWIVTPLHDLLDAQSLAALEDHVRGWPLAPVVVIAVFTLAGLVAAPATLLIGGTIVLFGPWPGVLYALIGMLTNGLLIYTIGRYGTRDMVQGWIARRAGSRMEAFNRTVGRRGFVAIALMRLTPFPYTIQNLLAGASRIGVVDFLLGTAIGVVPAITLMAGLVAQFDEWVRHPDAGQLVALIGAVVVVAVAGWSLRRWAVRRTSGP